MSDQARKKITKRQAEARRENGKKSRGPGSEDGKRRSSMNSLKHGYWARGLQPIDRGPLREDTEEMGQFLDAVIDELNPGDSVLLRQHALDVADKLWRQTRAQKWEAEGYSSPGSLFEDSGRADWLTHLARGHRRGAGVIRTMEDSSSSEDELWDALSPIAFHFKVSEDKLYEIGEEDVADVLETLIEENFDTPEEAARLLEAKAEDLESEADLLRSAIRPGIIRAELDGSFAKNSERMVGHASRELDRSLKRYWQLWERLQLTHPTVEGSDDPPDPEVTSSADAAVDSPDNVRSNDPHDSGQVDLRDVEALLDKILGSTQEN